MRTETKLVTYYCDDDKCERTDKRIQARDETVIIQYTQMLERVPAEATVITERVLMPDMAEALGKTFHYHRRCFDIWTQKVRNCQ